MPPALRIFLLRFLLPHTKRSHLRGRFFHVSEKPFFPSPKARAKSRGTLTRIQSAPGTPNFPRSTPSPPHEAIPVTGSLFFVFWRSLFPVAEGSGKK